MLEFQPLPICRRSWAPASGSFDVGTLHNYSASWSTAPVESTRVFGAYALPIAAPDMVGDRHGLIVPVHISRRQNCGR
eukprot:symbB.v1.2.009277.t1/scaffold584.1/size184464/12